MLKPIFEDLMESHKLLETQEKSGKNQDVKLIEEMAELTQAICKMSNGSTDMINLLEEFADVIVMMYSFQKRYNITDGDIYDLIESKLKRFERNNGGIK